ncbi:MAG: hypothetical protein IPL96_03190 [Holophagaceae bacterium]|nr:hypothetical protein [Holophagaceae bacterium]
MKLNKETLRHLSLQQTQDIHGAVPSAQFSVCFAGGSCLFGDTAQNCLDYSEAQACGTTHCVTGYC